ncbi:MAG: hypothetical protein ACJA1R_003136, partial [Flavobacteriales bacterium]
MTALLRPSLRDPRAFATLRSACVCDAVYFGEQGTGSAHAQIFDLGGAAAVERQSSAEAALMVGLAEAISSESFQGDTPVAEVVSSLRSGFVTWRQSPEHLRQPGTTVLGAATALCGDGLWEAASIPASKGSSPVARCVPFAFLPEHVWAGATQLQAAMTHAHPAVIASAYVTTAALRSVLVGEPRTGLLAHLHGLVQLERDHYREEWLGAVWQRGKSRSASGWIRRGWDSVGDQLIALADELGLLLGSPPVASSSVDYHTADVALLHTLRWWLAGPQRTQEDAFAVAASHELGSSVALLCGALVGASGAGKQALTTTCFDLEARVASVTDAGTAR